MLSIVPRPPQLLEDPPPALFVVGSPRSGTSLVYKVLCMHPGALYVSNWMNRFGMPAITGGLNRLARSWPSQRDRSWFSTDGNAYVYGGRQRPTAARLFPMPVEGHLFFSRFGATFPTGPGERGRIDRPRLRDALRRLQRSATGETFVSKRVIHNWYIADLAGAFPTARFVHVLRDGRDVAASLADVDWWQTSRVPWWGGTPEQWAAEGRDPWELCARTWVEETAIVERSLVGLDASRSRVVRYEDLLADPQATFASLRSFAGLRYDKRWSDAVAALRLPRPRPNAWEAKLPAQAQVVVQVVAQDCLTKYGYA